MLRHATITFQPATDSIFSQIPAFDMITKLLQPLSQASQFRAAASLPRWQSFQPHYSRIHNIATPITTTSLQPATIAMAVNSHFASQLETLHSRLSDEFQILIFYLFFANAAFSRFVSQYFALHESFYHVNSFLCLKATIRQSSISVWASTYISRLTLLFSLRLTVISAYHFINDCIFFLFCYHFTLLNFSIIDFSHWFSLLMISRFHFSLISSRHELSRRSRFSQISRSWSAHFSDTAVTREANGISRFFFDALAF